MEGAITWEQIAWVGGVVFAVAAGVWALSRWLQSRDDKLHRKIDDLRKDFKKDLETEETRRIAGVKELYKKVDGELKGLSDKIFELIKGSN